MLIAPQVVYVVFLNKQTLPVVVPDSYNAAKYFSASIAALQPLPAATIAWR